MHGSLQVTAREVRGWAFDPTAEAESVEVRLRVGDRVIAVGRAALPRPDVAASFGIAGDHGFRLPVALPEADAASLVAEARRPGQPWQPLAGPPARRAAAPHRPRRRRQYQSFDGAPGASRSADKLAALRLEMLPNRRGGPATPLEGLSLLDLGCNEGFFCGEALRQGATRVLGIDQSDAYLDRARARFPAAEFRSGSWWNLPDETFDVILLLSAIHYEPDQPALLRKLAGHLAPGGTLIVECGIAPGRGRHWRTVARADGRWRYPTFDLFVSDVCAPFAARLVGASVAQRGDPVPRRVFHCVIKQNMALVVVGPSRIGKTTLARQFGAHAIPVVSTDQLLGEILRDPRHAATPLGALARRFLPPPVAFSRVGNAIAAERPDDFVRHLLAALPRGEEMVCIEGEILRHRNLRDRLQRGLRTLGFRPWIITAQQPSRLAALAGRIGAALRGKAVTARVALVRLKRRAAPAADETGAGS